MKNRFAIAITVTSFASFGVTAIEACGSSDDSVPAAPVADATVDAIAALDADTDAFPGDAVADATLPKEGGWVCDPNVNFLDKVPDLPVGDGRTTGECVDCLNTGCAAPIKQCNLDCDCQAPIGNLLVCAVAAGADQGALFGCFANSGFASTTTTAQTEGASILTCMQRKCAAECLPQMPEAGLPEDADTSETDAEVGQ